MKIIILAGGKGTRLPHSAKTIPKALVKIKGKPIIEWQLGLLKKYGFTDIRMALGFRAQQICSYLKNQKECFIESEPLGSGGAIKFASKDLKEDFMVVNGDILTDLNVAEFVEFHRKKRAQNSIVAWKASNACSYGLVKIKKNGQVKTFLEKPEIACPGLINAGFYILSPKILKGIKKKSFSIEREIFPKLAQKGQLWVYVHKGQWIDLGTEERLAWARKHFSFAQTLHYRSTF